MKMVRKLSIGFALIVMGACASSPPDLNDNLIVRGDRVGDVELGMTLFQLFAARGAPRMTTPIPGTRATTYSYDGLVVAADDAVYWIIARDPRYRTEIGVGSGAEQILARGAYGKPKCVVTENDVTVYDYSDIYFEVDNKSGKVKEVGIMRDTQTCDG
ncbi:hypothetical protein [Hyphomonas sp.]|jgi:hypothetical protein|uniref:hypothetical protein n=1 Tax=Hyphomonas sp. TaxID=87 RepID=UPI00300114D1